MFHMWDVSTGIGWGMAFGWIWVLILWGGLAALIVWGITKLAGRSNDTSKLNPLDVAKERYAEGEISRDEFEQIKKNVS